MAQRVAGELYESLTGQLFEIGRQIRQPNGYPFDPQQLHRNLQKLIEGNFEGAAVAKKEIYFLACENRDNFRGMAREFFDRGYRAPSEDELVDFAREGVRELQRGSNFEILVLGAEWSQHAVYDTYPKLCLWWEPCFRSLEVPMYLKVNNQTRFAAIRK